MMRKSQSGTWCWINFLGSEPCLIRFGLLKVMRDPWRPRVAGLRARKAPKQGQKHKKKDFFCPK